MNFLDNIILDNTVKNYLYVLAIVFVTIVLKKYFSRYIASLLFKVVNSIWKNLNKNSFVDLVIEPIGWFLIVSITVFAIDKLNFPTALQFAIYGQPSENIIEKIGAAIIIIAFTILMLRIIDFIALVMEQKAATTKEKGDDQLVFFLRDFLKVLVVILSFLFLLKACFNQPVGTLLTSLSIVGAAIALAAKESLENLIASFIIFFDKPFTTGDTLTVNAVKGKVEKIGLRSTRIRTVERTLVTVPNKQMVDSVVDNLTMRNQRRAEIKLTLLDKPKSEKIKNLVEAIKTKLKNYQENILSSTVSLTSINKDGVEITIEYFTPSFSKIEFDILKEKINFEILTLLEL
ncbi:MAG: mechanosensitive ion channel domain-containing protein [Ferruginibacter sp.]|nr:mechanosensitive ion channel [Ferruginibacter sp.]